MLNLWQKNETYIGSWLANVLIARGLNQEEKWKLVDLGEIQGTKEKKTHRYRN